MRTVQAGPLSGLIAQLLLLAALAGTVGLSAAGWVVGVACAVVMCAVLARGVVRYGCKRFGPADWVTLTRASLAVGVAALTADSFAGATPVATLVTLATVALVLDSVDGWIVRRTGTATALGGQFDGEVDAFLIAVLSVYVASSVGAWVLAIGAMRYAFLVAGWFLPWLQEPLPTRYWAKVVAATQGIVLTIAAADILPLALTQAMLVISLALLAESFGHGIAWLWVRRGASRSRRAAAERSRPAPAVPRRGPVRTAIGVVLTILAVAVVWVALVTPDQLSRLTPGAYARLPLEGILVIALALVVPAPTRRLVACVVGPLFGLLLIVRILDMGFFEAFDRPFDPIADGSSTGIGIETLRDSIGRTEANLVVIGVATLAVGLLVVTTLAVLQLMRVAAGNRRWAFNAVTALGVVWVLSWLFGAQLVSNAPIASTSAAGLVVQEARAVQAGVDDPAVFANQIRADRYRNTPGKELLTGLRGKDVLLVFVESYGKVAVQDSSFSHKVDAVVNKGTEQLQASGFSSRSAFLTSSTFGGLSWLAHSTMQSGTWVNSQRRYDQLVKTKRLTLSQAFKRAGWRTVGDVPSNDRAWPEGTSFYGYDKLYDRRNVGYLGPKFSYASMPDQYVFLALQRLEIAKPHRRPLFAEVDLVSSHTPWNRIPTLIGWNEVGDGSIFNRLPVDRVTRAELFSHPEEVRAAYGRTIEYTMSALISFVQHYGNDNLVLIVLGDHQPAKVVTGEGPTHDVPISVIAHNPAVMDQISGWGWDKGLLPSPQAPLWRMSAFRDQFLSAFGSQPTAP